MSSYVALKGECNIAIEKVAIVPSHKKEKWILLKLILVFLTFLYNKISNTLYYINEARSKFCKRPSLSANDF